MSFSLLDNQAKRYCSHQIRQWVLRISAIAHTHFVSLCVLEFRKAGYQN